MIFTTQLDSTDISRNTTTTELKEQFGKVVNSFKLALLIPQFQVSILLTLIISDSGSQDLTMNSTSSNLMLVIITEPLERDKRLNISLVSFTQMTHQNKVKNLDLSNNISSALLPSEISFVDSRRLILIGTFSQKRIKFNLMIPIQLLHQSNS